MSEYLRSLLQEFEFEWGIIWSEPHEAPCMMGMGRAGSAKTQSMLGPWLQLLRTSDAEDSCQKLCSPYPKEWKVFSLRWGMTYGPLCLSLLPLNKSERDISVVWEKIKDALLAAGWEEVWPGARASGSVPTLDLLFVAFALLSVYPPVKLVAGSADPLVFMFERAMESLCLLPCCLGAERIAG